MLATLGNLVGSAALQPQPPRSGKVVAFHVVVVGCGGVGRGFHFGRLFCRTQPSGTIVASVFDIVIFRQCRDHSGAAGDLADTTQNDLRPSVIELDAALDLDGATGQTAHVSDVFQVMREDHHRERAGHLVFAEVEEGDPTGPDLHADYFPCHAFALINVLAGLIDGDTVGGVGEWDQPDWCENRDQRQFA